MNWPNAISILRLLLVPVVVILLMQDEFFKALLLILGLGLTDALDGFLARVLRQQTLLGAYLDPIADKTLMASCFVTLAIRHVIPGWLTVIVISRDVIILLGVAILFMTSVAFDVRPAFVSKLTTVTQIMTVFLSLAAQSLPGIVPGGWLIWLYWLTAALTIASGVVYVTRGVGYFNRSQKKAS